MSHRILTIIYHPLVKIKFSGVSWNDSQYSVCLWTFRHIIT